METFKQLARRAAIYEPTAPRSGNTGHSMLRLSNMILTGYGEQVYLQSYRGSLDLGETIPNETLTGTISCSLNSKSVTGSGTLFTSELESGQRLWAGYEHFMVDTITDDTHLTVYQGPTLVALGGTAATFFPVVFDLNRTRGTLRKGNAYELDKGSIIGTGFGTVRRNGSALSAVSQVSEAKSVGTAADSAAVGTVAWTNPGNITTSNGTGATCAPVGAAITTHYLKGTNCGFAAIPGGATITGISVAIKRRVTGATTEIVRDSAVKIVKADASIGTTNRATTAPWPNTNYQFSYYGGASDLWGETWTPADFADADVGVVFSAVTTDPGGEGATLDVDYIFITVYYVTTAGASMVLSGTPRLALFNPTSNKYRIFNLGLPAPTTVPTITSTAGGTHKMQPGDRSLRMVRSRSATNGYSNPGPRADFSIVNANEYASVDISAVPMVDGEDGFDYYATQLADTINPKEGPWDFVRTALDVEGNVVVIDYLNAEIDRQGILDYDNDPVPPAGFLAILFGVPHAVGCDGKYTGGPGPSVVPFKPGNIEACPAGWHVKSSPPQDILGVVTSLSRMYVLTHSTLQQGVFADSGNPLIPPTTLRPHWQVGFSNHKQLIFVNSMLVGYAHNGPTRSTEDVEPGNEQFFGDQVAEIIRGWIGPHVLLEHDPDPNVDAVCVFHPADSRNDAGFWRTRVLIWGLRQADWIGEAMIESDTRDMIVCSAAKVDQHLDFLAGGRYGAVRQVETATIVGTVSLTGNAKAVVTAVGMTGTPKTIAVPVVSGDTALVVAGKYRTVLAADVDVNAFFVVGGTGATVKLTARLTAANDATMNLAFDNDTCAGLTPNATSANTTAGNAGTVQIDTFRWNTASGTAVNWYAAHQFTDGESENQSKSVRAMRATGKFTNGLLQLYGYDSAVNISVTDIENGTNYQESISLGTITDVQQTNREEGVWPNLAVFTVRVSGTYSGSGDADRLDEIICEFTPEGNRK
jgi:hypothetical protein